ncbi:hypothetical protein BJ944DRAFT_115766 [Cunninghamella echinulata]|nr:hypothetical protein BJ944DRAFT_115766 [Cunninghamella echinulata]
MTDYSIDQQIHQLINNITGLNEHSVHWKQLKNNTLNKLKTHRFTDTEEHIIDQRYANLSNKFLIKAYDDLATDLINTKKEYQEKLKNCTAPQRKLSYDILSLLLELSDSPMEQHYEKKQRHLEKEKKEIENWNDVLNEEPLEGNHWQQWDDTEFDEDSMVMESKSDEFELDTSYDPNKVFQ